MGVWILHSHSRVGGDLGAPLRKAVPVPKRRRPHTADTHLRDAALAPLRISLRHSARQDKGKARSRSGGGQTRRPQLLSPPVPDHDRFKARDCSWMEAKSCRFSDSLGVCR